jgi:hypothetical protein
MWKYQEGLRMTIQTGKAFMVAPVKLLTEDYPVLAHQPFNRYIRGIIYDMIPGTAMAGETAFVIISKVRDIAISFKQCAVLSLLPIHNQIWNLD